jgi:hypothetical protein
MDGQRLLVLADTHGNVRALEAVLNWAVNRPVSSVINIALFLGDGTEDLSRAANTTGFCCEWKLVRGNNDFDSNLQDNAVFDSSGHRFFLCHGHRYALYNGYYSLMAAASKNEASVVLFGHTHVPYYKKANGLLLVNPGSVGRPRSRIGATFAVIECEQGKPLNVNFWGIGAKGEILEINI